MCKMPLGACALPSLQHGMNELSYVTVLNLLQDLPHQLGQQRLVAGTAQLAVAGVPAANGSSSFRCRGS